MRLALSILALAVAVWPAPADAQQRPALHPNIVFILTDDLSWNLVQFMPHVQQMQRQGATFSNYYVTDSLCCPSRSSIFTGRYPHDTGVFRNVGLDGGYQAFRRNGNDRLSFAVALTMSGYRNAFMGKYLNGYEPRRNDPVAPGWAEWDVAGGKGYGEFDYPLSENGTVVQYSNEPKDYLTDVMAAKALNFIRNSAGKPFMIEIATFAPHAPYVPAPRDADAFPGVQAPQTPSFGVRPDPSQPRWLQLHPGLPPQEVAAIDRDFRKRAQSDLAVDKLLGEVMETLAATGQAQNTYIVFSSDNGYHMGEHNLRPGKMTAFDMDIRVPLIVTGPGVPAGRTVEQFASNIDLCPTFTELAGTSPPGPVDGHSLALLLRGQAPADWRTLVLVEHRGPPREGQEPDDPDAPMRFSGSPPTYSAIRSKAWLYVEYVTGEREYHDLATDPNEMRNGYGSLSSEMKGRLHATVAAVVNCHDGTSCWAAQRGLAAQPIADDGKAAVSEAYQAPAAAGVPGGRPRRRQ